MLDFEPTTLIAFYALVWGAVLLVSVYGLSDRTHATTGLPMAFIGIYTTMHIGALVHLVPGYDHTLDPYLGGWQFTHQTVALGLEASALGMIGALLGMQLANVLLERRLTPAPPTAAQIARLLSHGKILLGLGLVSLVVEKSMDYAGIAIPGAEAILSNLRHLFVVGAVLVVLHRSLLQRSTQALLLTMAFSLVLPVTFLITTAILADSISASMACFAFYLAARPQTGAKFWGNVGRLGALVLAGFLFSTAYLENRDALRASLGTGASVESAAGQAASAASNYDITQSTQSRSLIAIDSRLDQNIFVGLAIEKLRSLPDTYENGETIMLAMLGWVPRVVWPGKPERGGSALITKHTTKVTNGSTTFGAGPVFEFYVNFGYSGVFAGFIIFGLMIRLIDIVATRAMTSGRTGPFTQYYLMGLALLQPLADLFFIVTSLASAAIVGAVLRAVMDSAARNPTQAAAPGNAHRRRMPPP